MDRRHCVINVKRNKQGELIYTLRDNQSITGTFLLNDILGDKDRVRIEEGAIITIGATTLILRTAENRNYETYYTHHRRPTVGQKFLCRKLALSLSSNPIYMATSRIWDEEFRQRVIKHQKRRGPEWTNIEEERN